LSEDTETVILSACRTPIGSFGGALKTQSAVDLGAVVIREAIARAERDQRRRHGHRRETANEQRHR